MRKNKDLLDDKERYATQVAEKITPLVSSTYSYRNLLTPMHTTARKIIPILCLSSVVVAVLNYFSYQAIIQIAQAKFSSIPTELMLEILGTFTVHATLLSVAPLTLSALNKTRASYIALVILSSAYTTFMTGINAVGPAIAIVIIGYLAFYSCSKAQDIYNYFRAK